MAGAYPAVVADLQRSHAPDAPGWRGAPDSPGALARWAPGPAARLAEATGAVTLSPGLVAAVRDACAGVLGLEPLPPPASAPLETGDRAGPAVDFARQFSLDVSSVTADLRSSVGVAFGGETGELAAAVFVADFVPRARAALDALFGAPGVGWPPPPPAEVPSLWPTLNEFSRLVHNLSALDPVTAELVRLRGARQHRCRLCKSLRALPALRAGAGEELFDQVDRYEEGDLPERQRAALRFVDALVWTPGRIDRPVVAGVRRHFTPGQSVELVLDVTRNAMNKIAVALDVDQAHVPEGVEVYDTDPDGTVHYGLPAPVASTRC